MIDGNNNVIRYYNRVTTGFRAPGRRLHLHSQNVADWFSRTAYLFVPLLCYLLGVACAACLQPFFVLPKGAFSSSAGLAILPEVFLGVPFFLLFLFRAGGLLWLPVFMAHGIVNGFFAALLLRAGTPGILAAFAVMCCRELPVFCLWVLRCGSRRERLLSGLVVLLFGLIACVFLKCMVFPKLEF